VSGSLPERSIDEPADGPWTDRAILAALRDPDQRRNVVALLELMQTQLTPRPGLLLQHLANRTRAELYYFLADWLNAQNRDFDEVLRDLVESDRGRRWLYDALNQARMDFEFKRAKEHTRLRELYLAELFPGIGDVSVSVGAINEESGLPNKVDMLYVSAIAAYFNVRKIFEIGTYLGRTTYHLARSVPEGTVYTLDLPPTQAGEYGPYLGAYLEARRCPSNVVRLEEDSRRFNTTPYQAQIDLVFVDADHSYEMVANDTSKALELVRPNGLVIWHDYAPKTPGVYRFLRDFSQTQPIFHVRNTALAIYRQGVDSTRFEASAMLPSLEARFKPD
jgi:predicted O-methyltransferase YrrM